MAAEANLRISSWAGRTKEFRAMTLRDMGGLPPGDTWIPTAAILQIGVVLLGIRISLHEIKFLHMMTRRAHQNKMKYCEFVSYWNKI